MRLAGMVAKLQLSVAKELQIRYHLYLLREVWT